jgi:hypothetical protein
MCGSRAPKAVSGRRGIDYGAPGGLLSSSLELVNDKLIPAQCEGVMMARWESPVGVGNIQVELSPDDHPPKVFYIVRGLVRGHQEVPASILTATRPYQAHERFPLGKV